MKKLRTFFLSRHLREKFFLLTLVALGAAIWYSSLVRRARFQVREFQQTKTDLSVQKQWLARQTQIEASAKAAVEHLDPARSFNSVRLNAELSAIAKSVGLSRDFQTNSPRTERTNEFAVHTVQFSANHVELDVIVRFYQELLKRAPYIGLEQFALAADRTDARFLNASFRVTSVEIAR